MKATIMKTDGTKKGKIELPAAFSTAYRPDLIQLAVYVMQSQKRQPYGTDPLAGKRSSAHYHGSRHYRFTMMNKEMSRIPRIHGTVGYMALRARVAPHAVKGRKAHPPKAEKKWEKKMNKKQMLLAIQSALAATADAKIVRERGHIFETKSLPVVVESGFERVAKTAEAEKILKKLGLEKELKRCSVKKVRAGKGKMRGRRYKKKKGPLIVVSEECPLLRSARNIAGVDILTVKDIFENQEIEMLAPGTIAGRLTVITENAVRLLQNHGRDKNAKGKRN
ncbi:MAG: 50S ribosomal protein L4 [Candidatus Aenigmarchaeota archaeon]|nr:50S ribosomal protein L4 [Candidatus Aenigmarchaeota archaeon]